MKSVHLKALPRKDSQWKKQATALLLKGLVDGAGLARTTAYANEYRRNNGLPPVLPQTVNRYANGYYPGSGLFPYWVCGFVGWMSQR